MYLNNKVMTVRLHDFKPGQQVRTRVIRHIFMWGKRWPIAVNEVRKVVRVEPQGILLDDNLYYAASWLTPI
ncbi:hypothetical protein DYU11_18555 [Fibrisoma montanum]|uniref:Uncharacterized protein n=1 Tax=Fibrisoma montanum TaxID=2305895 RepID=A0A418M635_9BACT|nr:hypothetical protein DYU11_18555 [Fibrisoma montanum]